MNASGRVRAMYDSYGNKVDYAGPSVPVQVLGLSAVPTTGDQVNVVADEQACQNDRKPPSSKKSRKRITEI